ncbi:quiver-like [Homarus americanus]|uniref:Quiver-like n=1 Tax=Homarus americanus TaxID=6706 RepID=A0A8J5KG53_HOMAM|nr:quiver-like [Homarus americanus]
MYTGNVMCYECSSWTHPLCDDPFNFTLSAEKGPPFASCDGCCVKLVQNIGTRAATPQHHLGPRLPRHITCKTIPPVAATTHHLGLHLHTTTTTPRPATASQSPLLPPSVVPTSCLSPPQPTQLTSPGSSPLTCRNIRHLLKGKIRQFSLGGRTGGKEEKINMSHSALLLRLRVPDVARLASWREVGPGGWEEKSIYISTY